MCDLGWCLINPLPDKETEPGELGMKLIKEAGGWIPCGGWHIGKGWDINNFEEDRIAHRELTKAIYERH